MSVLAPQHVHSPECAALRAVVDLEAARFHDLDRLSNRDYASHWRICTTCQEVEVKVRAAFNAWYAAQASCGCRP